MKILLERVRLKTSTPGSVYLGHSRGLLLCKTIELPWLDNQNNISCYPEGDYVMVKEATSPLHPYPHFRVLNVPNRRGILWHVANYVSELKGCTAVGSAHKDMDADTIPDVVDSTLTLNRLYAAFDEEVYLKVRLKS